jgi:hypothetical protein
VILAHKKLPNDQYSNPDLPGLIRVRHIIVCEPDLLYKFQKIIRIFKKLDLGALGADPGR